MTDTDAVPDPRIALLANRLGALSTVLSDMIAQSGPAELPASGPDMAALNTVALWPGTRIEELAAILGLSQSGTVRPVDRLAEAIEDLLRLLAYDVPAANRICPHCDARICTLDICPTEHRVREQAARAARFGPARGDGGAGGNFAFQPATAIPPRIRPPPLTVPRPFRTGRQRPDA